MNQQKTNVGGATFINQVALPTIKVKPQPSTWVHMAQAKWCRENETTNLPSYNEGSTFNIQAQEKVIEAIQEEQNRVYHQDQQLLKNLHHKVENVQTDQDNHNTNRSMQFDRQYDSINESIKEGSPRKKEYRFKDVEDDIIKYICEKIVAMRE